MMINLFKLHWLEFVSRNKLFIALFIYLVLLFHPKSVVLYQRGVCQSFKMRHNWFLLTWVQTALLPQESELRSKTETTS